MQMSKYVRLTNSVTDKGQLLPLESFNIENYFDKEYYVSTYLYNEDHYKHFLINKSVKGIKDVTTNKLWFDFDHESDPELARTDAITVVDRLSKYGIKDKDIEIYFSGNKGYNVLVTLNRFINPEQAQSIAIHKFGKDLATLDYSLYDANQILRIPGTIHPKSKLYKIPLTRKELENINTDEIKIKAKSLENVTEDFNWQPVELGEELLKVEAVKKEFPKATVVLDKPRHWKDYKYNLLQGKFDKGERHSAMMVLAATCRGLGYDADTATAMCLSADQKHCALTDDTPVEDLESNIIPSIYSSDWKGGQYSPKSDPWLAKYCAKHGFDTNNDASENTMGIADAFDIFKDYALHIDELTVKTGIPQIDKKLRMTIGMVVGLLAAPGVGKTSVALQMLNNMSKQGEQCIFFSYDMYSALVIQKLVQRHLNIDGDDIFDKIQSGDAEFEAKILNMLKTEYTNVEFCFKQGQTPKDIEETIKAVEDKTGKKVRFVVIDYGELIMSDLSDATAASAQVQHRLRAIANTYNVCILSLLQPNKMSGSPEDDIKSYRAAKGSSAIEQTVSVMLGMSRPGYDPKIPENDQFVSISALKVRMGSLFSCDLHWEGLTGTVREMTFEETAHLREIKDAKKAEEGTKDSAWA